MYTLSIIHFKLITPSQEYLQNLWKQKFSLSFSRRNQLNFKMLVIIFLSVLAVAAALWGRNRHLRMTLLQRSGVPGPPPHFLWGNMQKCFSMPNVQWDSSLLEKYGPVAGYYLGAKPIIVTDDADLFKRIQKQESSKFLERPRRVPGGISPDPNRRKMLANLNVEQWREVRKVLTPGFSPAKLKAMIPQVSTLTNVFLGKVGSAVGTSVDFYRLFQGLTLDIIGRTGFGVESNIQTNLEDPLHLAVQEEFAKSPSSWLVKVYLALPEFSFILQPLRLFIHKYSSQSQSNALWDLGRKIVMERITMGSSRPDLLQLLIQSHFASEDPMKAVANAVLFFEAAYETMSSTMGFLVHFLCNHEDVQDKLREEIQNFLQDEEDTQEKLSSFDFVEKLTYMNAVLKETLRILPPQTTFISRCGSEDLIYETGDGQSMTIPAGVHIQLGLFQLHRSENNFPNPLQFNPDRFLQDGGSIQAYQPFGAGPRSCIGERYSFMVIKLVMANLLFHFKLLPCPQTEKEIQLKFKTATMTPLIGSFAQPVAT